MEDNSEIFIYYYIFILGTIGLYFEKGYTFIFYYINNNNSGQYYLRNSDINNDIASFEHSNPVELSLLYPPMFINDLKLNEMLQSQNTSVIKMTIIYLFNKMELGYLIK